MHSVYVIMHAMLCVCVCVCVCVCSYSLTCQVKIFMALSARVRVIIVPNERVIWCNRSMPINASSHENHLQ